MPFDQMQDLLNALQNYFKVFIHVQQQEIVLRVFIDNSPENVDYTDIYYNFTGEYLRNS